MEQQHLLSAELTPENDLRTSNFPKLTSQGMCKGSIISLIPVVDLDLKEIRPNESQFEMNYITYSMILYRNEE